ncbi:hypothetical protein ACFO4O_00280 [Glaciecola siphonariae]|uniref:PAC domain-containing protein n=1 Tax=Glaciecola siphonariae TaxID=521012 RepID=A0ABV9LRL6_9ALTE
MTNDDLENKIRQLELQLQRERATRKKAEDILRQKTLEVFDANERITTATRRLQAALWASRESVWEWTADDNMYRLYTLVTEREVIVHSRGTLEELMLTFSERSAEKFMQAWQDHTSGLNESFHCVCHRKSSTTGKWRWVRITGRIVSRNDEGMAKQFIGIFKDITYEYEQDQTFRMITYTYLRTEQPGFIIRVDNHRVEGTDSMFALLGGERRDFSQEQLRQSLPIELIIHNQKTKERLFEHAVVNLKGESIMCQFILPKMLEDKDKAGVYSYAVGFFRPKK